MVAITIRRVAVFAIAMLVLGSTPFAVAVAGDGGSDDRTRLEAELTETAGGDGSGKAKFEFRPDDRTRLSIEIEDVGADGCAAFTATINGEAVAGTFELDVDVCDLNLDDRDGDTVPDVDLGDEVTVTNNQGTTLTGTFELKE